MVGYVFVGLGQAFCVFPIPYGGDWRSPTRETVALIVIPSQALIFCVLRDIRQ